MVWWSATHQRLRMQWCGYTLLTKHYKYISLKKSMAHQTLRIQLFLYTWLTKPYKYNSVRVHGSPTITHTTVLGTRGSPNITNTMVWMPKAHHTLRIHWFGDTWLTKQYKYNGLIVRGSQNVTYTIMWGHMAHQTLQIQCLDCPWLTKRYIYNGVVGLLTKPYKYISLKSNGSPNVTYT